MPYVHRIVKAGKTIEHKKMMCMRVHSQGVRRRPNRERTSEKQKKINERRAEESLRWKLNANFGHKDRHIVLHYGDKEKTFAKCLKDRALFLRKLREECQKEGIPLKYIAVTETKRLSNIHHHIIVNREVPTDIIAEVWERVAGASTISFSLLDRRGNHAKLASYLMKESKSTMERYREEGKRGKRFSASQNLITPEPKYYIVSAESWRKEPKARKGAVLYKFDDGSECRSGWHEVNGYPYQEYYEIFGP